ncbi:hypothetical protein BT69DRAFT_1283994 [Atractiella rhizophila]|nr:hypothetical protein BT69DRAFT_1283994 [Atractiella rhizophila]
MKRIWCRGGQDGSFSMLLLVLTSRIPYAVPDFPTQQIHSLQCGFRLYVQVSSQNGL